MPAQDAFDLVGGGALGNGGSWECVAIDLASAEQNNQQKYGKVTQSGLLDLAHPRRSTDVENTYCPDTKLGRT